MNSSSSRESRWGFPTDHKGRCDRTYNFAHPFAEEIYETDVEYVAPVPSTWRLDVGDRSVVGIT